MKKVGPEMLNISPTSCLVEELRVKLSFPVMLFPLYCMLPLWSWTTMHIFNKTISWTLLPLKLSVNSVSEY